MCQRANLHTEDSRTSSSLFVIKLSRACVHVFIRVRIRVFMAAHVIVHVCTSLFARVWVCPLLGVRVFTCAPVYSRAYVCVHSCACACSCKRVFTWPHTCMRLFIVFIRDIRGSLFACACTHWRRSLRADPHGAYTTMLT